MNNASLACDNLSQAALSISTPVSVIMPVRNEERHLAEAVRHVLARLPAALAIMHICWGTGFLPSPRRLITRAPRAPG
jgi:hypothetical protein